jgi:hypothetical protein
MNTMEQKKKSEEIRNGSGRVGSHSGDYEEARTRGRISSRYEGYGGASLENGFIQDYDLAK